MKKSFKYTTALSSATVAMAFAVSIASANSSIVNSGNNASLNTSSNTNTSVSVTNSNTANVNQSSISSANTGGNSSKGNINGGSIASGAASTSTKLDAQANQNQTAVTLPTTTPAAGNSAEVVNTGNHLDLDNSTNQNTSVSSSSVNSFAGQQQSLGISNSGGNTTHGNIGGGSIATGAAGVSNDFGVEANMNQTALNLGNLGAMAAMNGLSFTNTGNHATIDNSHTVNTSVLLSSVNSAMVSQSAFGMSNSGLNFASGNINGGSIATGAAGASNVFDIMVNKNTTGLAFGSSVGGDTEGLDITNTGNHLDLNGSTTVNTSVSASSTNGSSTAQSSVDVSNSGLNFSNSNIGGGTTGTGSAGVWSGFMSGGNWNQTMVN